jgi:16S rRNA (guanine(966)-N(2))-methyltransferase RsmD
MNMLAARIPGCRWLDLCCGSGVMACEALRRGAEVVAVERNRRVAAVARANLELVAGDLASLSSVEGHDPPRWTVVCDEVLRWLVQHSPDRNGSAGAWSSAFDLVYVDPPYRDGLYGPIAERISRGGWLRFGGTMLWEASRHAMPEVPRGWRLEDLRPYGGTAVMVLAPEGQPPRALPRRY